MKTIITKCFALGLAFCYSGLSAQAPVYTVYRPDMANIYASDNDLACITVDPAGKVWAGSRAYHAPLKKFDGTNWTSYQDSVYSCVYGEASAIVVDNMNNVWYSTLGGGISKFNGTTFTNYTSSNSGLANNFVTCMTSTNTGDLFLYASNFHKTQKLSGSSWSDLESFSYGVKMSYDAANNIIWMDT